MTGGIDARPRRGAWAGFLALVLVLALCVLASAAGAGPWERRVENDPETREPLPTEYIPPEATEPPASGDRPDPLSIDPGVLRIVLTVVAIVAIVGLLVLIARFIRSVEWGRRSPGKRRAGLAVAADAEEVVDAATLVTGIEAAQAVFRGEVSTTDAIIAAWLALEHAAEASGAPRSPSQTPTEFTSTVLQRVPADTTAVQELLGLYSRARFSTAPLPPEAADAARAALRDIATSWSAVEVSS